MNQGVGWIVEAAARRGVTSEVAVGRVEMCASRYYTAAGFANHAAYTYLRYFSEKFNASLDTCSFVNKLK